MCRPGGGQCGGRGRVGRVQRPAAALAAAALRLPTHAPSPAATVAVANLPTLVCCPASLVLLQYPGDVGVLAAWFLNYLRLQPGQAVALPANEPHAYISGEIMECMATSGRVPVCVCVCVCGGGAGGSLEGAAGRGCGSREGRGEGAAACSAEQQQRRLRRVRLPDTSSALLLPCLSPLASLPPPPPTDNVIRAGLTPKLRDTEVLCESLTYGQGVPEVLTGAKSAASPHLALYRPPFR